MHWRNSRFQVVAFIVGKAHTPDEAYRLLCELKEDRQVPIKEAQAAAHRQKAKALRAKDVLSGWPEDTAEYLDAEADLFELEAHKDQSQACYDEALRELEFIERLITQIQPLRRYAHLPDYEAHQACQSEEWLLKLAYQAENQLITRGGIDSELMATIRLHPQCDSILKGISNLQQQVRTGQPLAIERKESSALNKILLESSEVLYLE